MNNNVVILNFSPRPEGNCGSICALIYTFYENSNICLYNLSSFFTPCGGCDYECLKPNRSCPSLSQKQAEVYEAICHADLVYYIVPNFCGMPNSLYYAFNERSVGFFNMNRSVMSQYMSAKKRFIIVSNTESNTFTEAMQQQTESIPEILYMKTSSYGKKSIAGDLMDSQEAKADLLMFLSASHGDI